MRHHLDVHLDVAALLEGPKAIDVLAVPVGRAGARLDGLRLRSVHHRPPRSSSWVYDATVTVGHDSSEVVLVAHTDRDPPVHAVPSVTVGDTALTVWRFPHDPYLPGLASAVHAGRVRELLDALGGPAGSVALHTRAYRPSRRAVVEVAVGGVDAPRATVLYLKVLAGKRAAEVAAVHRTLDGLLPVPRVIGVASRQGIVAFEALRGDTLRTVLETGGDRDLPPVDAVVGLSQAIAASGLRTARDPRAFADPTRHVAILTTLVPDQAARIAQVAAAVAGLDGPAVPVHGDLHDGQILVADGNVVGLLDLDGAGMGLLAEDAGSLIARLELFAARRALPAAVATRAGDYAGAVREAYAHLVGAQAVRLATAGAWLALATGPHRAQDPGWDEATRGRIARAEAALQ